ncbi:MAG: DUF2889 domain-containing protein, partial [Frankia sp.]
LLLAGHRWPRWWYHLFVFSGNVLIALCVYDGGGGRTSMAYASLYVFVAVDAFFRDSHVDGGGLETVVHEYSVAATIDPATMRFTDCQATIGVLPWQECPGAVGSARRLVGTPVEGLRTSIRESFVGTSTCTHLNDTLRALEDVGDLVRELPHAE